MEPLEMQYQESKQPLLAQTTAQGLPSQQLVYSQPYGRKDFHLHWCNCFGDCDAPGWAACCLSSWLPCIATGWNLHRASGKANLGWVAGLLLLTAFVALPWSLTNIYRVTEESYLCADNHESCTRYHPSLNITAAVVMGVSMLLPPVIGVVSRRYIRRALNLDSLNDNPVGVFCCDFWSHFLSVGWFPWLYCCGFLGSSFGLCQETRTMIINNVDRGVWRGPSTMIVPAMSVSNQISQEPVYNI